MSGIGENLERIETRIAAACRAAGRGRAEVELMAVSKTHPAAALGEAAALGLRLFGENRVQEYGEKFAETAGLWAAREPRPRCHLIGHLQSNKAARAAELFDGVDSLDSLRLAVRLNDAAVKLNKHLPVLLEVKLSTEETKSGIGAESVEAAELLERLPELEHLEVRGLMTVAPLGVSAEETRSCFAQLRGLRERWAQKHPRLSFEVLSMGMSGDFELAIAEGATRVRIGSAIFGARSYPERG